jgi:hypothetical protein
MKKRDYKDIQELISMWISMPVLDL